jgi:hypothetical protein
MGVTCESITIGHNNYRLPLTANHIVIPTNGRPEFLSEKFLRTQLDKVTLHATYLYYHFYYYYLYLLLILTTSSYYYYRYYYNYILPRTTNTDCCEPKLNPNSNLTPP